jgi:hypothetical protein
MNVAVMAFIDCSIMLDIALLQARADVSPLQRHKYICDTACGNVSIA